MAEFNEGGRREPCYAKTEQVLVDHIYQNRFAELENLRDYNIQELNIQEFGDMFSETYIREMSNIFEFAEGGNLDQFFCLL